MALGLGCMELKLYEIQYAVHLKNCDVQDCPNSFIS